MRVNLLSSTRSLFNTPASPPFPLCLSLSLSTLSLSLSSTRRINRQRSSLSPLRRSLCSARSCVLDRAHSPLSSLLSPLSFFSPLSLPLCSLPPLSASSSSQSTNLLHLRKAEFHRISHARTEFARSRRLKNPFFNRVRCCCALSPSLSHSLSHTHSLSLSLSLFALLRACARARLRENAAEQARRARDAAGGSAGSRRDFLGPAGRGAAQDVGDADVAR